MTFSYCYIGHICITFQIPSLQTSMIFGGFGCRRTILWTLFWTLCVPLYPLDTWYVHFQFKILKICSKKGNDIETGRSRVDKSSHFYWAAHVGWAKIKTNAFHSTRTTKKIWKKNRKQIYVVTYIRPTLFGSIARAFWFKLK